MPIQAIGFVTILVGLFALWRSIALPYAALAISTLFGAAAALLLPGIGTVQPGHLMLGFALIAVLINPSVAFHSKKAFAFPSAGFWLCCICLFAILSAFFYPRLFRDAVDINALSTPDYALDYFKIALKPTNGNITQSVYFIGDLVCFAVFFGFAAQRGSKYFLVRTFLAYGTANIMFAGLDLLTSSLHASWLLDFMRNSTYIIYADSSVGDARRIIGSFSEAAAFASATVGIMLFAFRLWLGGVYRKWSLGVALTSLLLLLASTSSTAYVAMVMPFGFLVIGSIVRGLDDTASLQDIVLLMFGPLLLAAAASWMFMNDGLYSVISEYLSNVLFAKANSTSAMERSRLNYEAFDVLRATHFVGAGLGSIRTSSFALAVLANLGLIGGALYGAFLCLVLLPRQWNEARQSSHIRAAARFGCLGLLCAAITSGTTTDLGLSFFSLAALAVAPPDSATATERSLQFSARPRRLAVA